MRRSNIANLFPLLGLVVLGCDRDPPSAPSGETHRAEFRISSSSTVLFQEDFESYAPGSNLVGQGGWFLAPDDPPGQGGPMFVTAGSGLNTQVANGHTNPGTGNFSRVTHLLSGPLNPSGVSIFSFDAFAFTSPTPRTHNVNINLSSVGLSHQIVWQAAFNPPGEPTTRWNFVYSGFLSGYSLTIFEGGYDEPVEGRIIVDGAAGEVYGQLVHSGGVFETPHLPITAAEIASIVRVQLVADYRFGCCLGGEVDNLLVKTEPTTLAVEIDIKPGSDPNSIACSIPAEVIPVAILTTDDFDATTVDHTSVAFGPSGASEFHSNRRGVVRHEEDADGDGDTDLVFHFRNGDTGIQCGDTEASLTGQTFDGIPIEGQDAINTVP